MPTRPGSALFGDLAGRGEPRRRTRAPLGERTLREFVQSRAGHKHQPALKAALDAWFDEVRKARWSSTADIKQRYASASIVSSERIVFNTKGNDYRLVVSVEFEKGIVRIKWLGTHRDYDRLDVKEVEHERP